MNKVEITKKDKITDIRINGFRLPAILDYQIRTNPRTESTELVLTFDVAELITHIKE